MKAFGIFFIVVAILLSVAGFIEKDANERWKRLSSNSSGSYRDTGNRAAEKHSTNMAIFFGIGAVLFIAGVIMVASGGTPETETRPKTAIGPGGGIQDKLSQLLEMKNSGLISEAEFISRKTELLDSLTKERLG